MTQLARRCRHRVAHDSLISGNIRRQREQPEISIRFCNTKHHGKAVRRRLRIIPLGRTKCLWRGQFHTIGARLYGVEQVLAQGIRDHGASGLASIQHGVAIAVFIQRDLNAALPVLICVQQAVAIGIDEDEVTNTGKGHKPKVCQSVRNAVSGCGGVRTGARLIIRIGIRPCIGGAKARRRDDFNRVGSRRYIDKGVTAVTGRRHTVVKRASGVKQIDHHTLDPRLVRIANAVKIKILKHQVSNRAKRRKGKVGVTL